MIYFELYDMKYNKLVKKSPGPVKIVCKHLPYLVHLGCTRFG